ncbi:MAG: GIY-YIG nuclease family protein [Patescibacteria group bacterium]
MPNKYWMYIVTNQRNTVLYTGITNDIDRRIYEHKNKIVKGFTAKYNIDKLVYIEEYSNPEEAIAREKQIKAGSRKNKIQLIKKSNPHWRDLSDELIL